MSYEGQSVTVERVYLNGVDGELWAEFFPCSYDLTYKLKISHLSFPDLQLIKELQTFDNIITNAVVYLSDDVMSYLKSYASNASNVVLGVVVETWDNGSLIGSSSTVRYYLFDTANPIVKGTVVDTNEKTIALTGNSKKLIKYYSNAKATMTADAQWGATIDESQYVIKNGINTAYTTECIFEEVENNSFAFFAQDSRGKVGRYTLNPIMVDYIKLTCNITKNRPDALGNMDLSCVGAFFNGDFGKVKNTLTVQYRYTITGTAFSDDWEDMNVTKYEKTYYASADVTIDDFDQNQYYSFEIRVTDKLDTITATESGLKSLPIFHWGEDDFVFEVPVTFKGGLIDEKAEPLDTEYGVWTPSMYTAPINSWVTRQGWYQKVGKVVTIGFYIKVSCNGTYTDNIYISDLPYEPLYSAAGGGMCSGAKVSAGFNFQCFVAESDGYGGKIRTRVQACNNTSEGNLQTSASGCKFPTSAGDLTLSGTITYIAKE